MKLALAVTMDTDIQMRHRMILTSCKCMKRFSGQFAARHTNPKQNFACRLNWSREDYYAALFRKHLDRCMLTPKTLV